MADRLLVTPRMLLVLAMCHACVAEPEVLRAELTIAAPCPADTKLGERRFNAATCSVRDTPGQTVDVEFFDHDGSLAAYTVKVEGVREGASARWRDGRRRDHGRYARGEKTGRWEEWGGDGGLYTGVYVDGKRDGEWHVRQGARRGYFLHFAAGGLAPWPQPEPAAPPGYQTVMAAIDIAWLGVALYGYHQDNHALAAAGAAGLLVTAPLVHALLQHADRRRTAVERSVLLRPVAVAGVLAAYSIYKYFAGLDCKAGTDDDGNSSRCAVVESNYNWSYNWAGVALASGLAIMAFDTVLAQHRDPFRVVAIPARGGASVGVSGRF